VIFETRDHFEVYKDRIVPVHVSLYIPKCFRFSF